MTSRVALLAATLAISTAVAGVVQSVRVSSPGSGGEDASPAPAGVGIGALAPAPDASEGAGKEAGTWYFRKELQQPSGRFPK